MAERQLNEQWVEELDGKMHMLKAVKGNTTSAKRCSGCAFNNEHKKLCELPGGVFHISEIGCARQFLIIKDLGILNEDGCLPCPFPDGGYPTIQRGANWGDGEWVDCYWVVYKAHKIYICTGQFPTEQEAVDAWNRRA